MYDKMNICIRFLTQFVPFNKFASTTNSPKLVSSSLNNIEVIWNKTARKVVDFYGCFFDTDKFDPINLKPSPEYTVRVSVFLGTPCIKRWCI